jgi:hypothetical protein
MHRTSVFLACAASLLCNMAAGQSFAPRSIDYLFAATAYDARAIWLNPAGLAVAPEASIFAEFVMHRLPDADLRVSQLSFGFNSQGLAFGYYRERLASDSSNHTYRIAFARALQNWTLGISMSYFRSDVNDKGFDVGVRYRVMRSLDLGVVVQNLGQPQVRQDTLPVTGVVGLGWEVLRGAVVLTGETLVHDRMAESGYDLLYRAGATVSVGRNIPFSGLTAVQLDNNLGVLMWTFGISVGRNRRGVLVAGVNPTTSPAQLETVSLTGIATNPLSTWRR